MGGLSYYQTRRFAAHDERLLLLPEGFFSGATVLDIGCNEGWVSCEIGEIPPTHIFVI
jgi:2-polyprenyl-3-methyl-5-hydroxy-6-metoxy-1,4-benzoquinol methylase